MKPESLIRIAERQLGRKNVRVDDRFVEDLGAESIDLVNLMVAVEEETGIFIPEEKIPELRTLKELLEYIHFQE